MVVNPVHGDIMVVSPVRGDVTVVSPVRGDVTVVSLVRRDVTASSLGTRYCDHKNGCEEIPTSASYQNVLHHADAYPCCSGRVRANFCA